MAGDVANLKPRTVVGIDPGNDSAGLTVSTYQKGRLVYELSCTLHIWDVTDVHLLMRRLLNRAEGKVYVFLEIPENGTHQSRAGVNRAGGVLLGWVLTAAEVKRSALHLVKPSEWRTSLFGSVKKLEREELKALAMDYFKKCKGHEPMSDDQAESLCLARYGNKVVLSRQKRRPK